MLLWEAGKNEDVATFPAVMIFRVEVNLSMLLRAKLRLRKEKQGDTTHFGRVGDGGIRQIRKLVKAVNLI